MKKIILSILLLVSPLSLYAKIPDNCPPVEKINAVADLLTFREKETATGTLSDYTYEVWDAIQWKSPDGPNPPDGYVETWAVFSFVTATNDNDALFLAKRQVKGAFPAVEELGNLCRYYGIYGTIDVLGYARSSEFNRSYKRPMKMGANLISP